MSPSSFKTSWKLGLPTKLSLATYAVKKNPFNVLDKWGRRRRMTTTARSTTTTFPTAYSSFQVREPSSRFPSHLFKQPQATLNSHHLAFLFHSPFSLAIVDAYFRARCAKSHWPLAGSGTFLSTLGACWEGFAPQRQWMQEEERDPLMESMEPDSGKGQPEGDPTGQGSNPGNPGNAINQRGRRLESRNTGHLTERSSYGSTLHCPSQDVAKSYCLLYTQKSQVCEY